VNNLEELKKLRSFATDKGFQQKWAAVKRAKKVQLAALIKKVRLVFSHVKYVLRAFARATRISSMPVCVLDWLKNQIPHCNNL
jgi:glucan phosphorylase